MNAIELIKNQQAQNRLAYANKLKAQSESEAMQQQFAGRILGVNAESGLVQVQLEDGGEISGQSVTSGLLKPGMSAIVTFNGNKAWVDGMPS